jgi:hypothetical protein
MRSESPVKLGYHTFSVNVPWLSLFACWFRALILSVVSAFTYLSWGYTYSQIGVDSNFLIDDGRVIFVQSDGSLTVLSFESGKVLLREKSRDYSGTLKRVPEGILVFNYGTITLLNPDNLNVLWDTKLHYEPNVLDGALVSYDGNGLVQCRDLKNGGVKWSLNLPGALEVVAESGKVLIHRAATYEEESTPTTVLLDLNSGTELFRKGAPSGTHWEHVFFDGTNIFVASGRYSKRRSDYLLERLAIWNTSGDELGSIPIVPGLREKLRYGDESFDLDSKTFYRQRVYASRELIPPDQFGKRVVFKSTEDQGSTTYGYDLGGGITLVERPKDSDGQIDQTVRTGLEIKLQTPAGYWKGILPYLTGRGCISAVGNAKGKILIGTSLGHVECIDVFNGQSQWLYVFPTMRHTMSYSSRGMPPMMSQAAATFRRENSVLPHSGFQPINGKPGTPIVIFDPNPTNPFRKLPLYLAFAWGGSGFPILLVVVLHIKWRMRQIAPVLLGAAAISLTGLAQICFFEFGRVSPGSSIALRLTILMGLLYVLWQAIKCYRLGKRNWALMFTVLTTAIAGVIFPALLAL